MIFQFTNTLVFWKCIGRKFFWTPLKFAMVTRKNKMTAKYVEFDRKPNFIPKFRKIGLACWSGLSKPTHSQCGPLQRAIVAKWLTYAARNKSTETSPTSPLWIFRPRARAKLFASKFSWFYRSESLEYCLSNRCEDQASWKFKLFTHSRMYTDAGLGHWRKPDTATVTVHQNGRIFEATIMLHASALKLMSEYHSVIVYDNFWDT